MAHVPTTLVEMLRLTAERYPDHGVTFYDSPDESSFVSYRELDDRAKRIAVALTARGYRPGDVAALGLEPGLPFFEAVYGAFYAGLTVAPTAMAGARDAATIATRLTPILRGSGARLVITQPSVLEALDPADQAALPAEPTLVTTATLLDEGDAGAWVEPAEDRHAVAALMFTSGSTGRPKGVMMTHGSILEGCKVFKDVLGASAQSTFVGWMPVHHAAGLTFEVFIPVLTGSNVILTGTAQFQRRPFFWMQLLSDHRATHTVAANFAFDITAQLASEEQVAQLDLSSLQSMLSGAEPVRMDTIRRFVDRFGAAGVSESVIMPVLAMTEALILAMKLPGTEVRSIVADAISLEEHSLVPATDGRAVEIVSSGPIGPGHTVRIVDPVALEPVPDGTIGEIWVSGPAVSAGYWQNPEATAEAFGNRLADDDRTYLRTGDLGGLIDGELFVTGRLKDLIIIRGRNIYPQDLEAAAKRVPGVGIGAAFELSGHPSDVGIVLEFDPEQVTEGIPNAAEAARDVRALLVGEFSLPSLAVALIPPATLPRTPAGKVQRAITRTVIEEGGLPLVHVNGFAPTVQQRDTEPVP